MNSKIHLSFIIEKVVTPGDPATFQCTSSILQEFSKNSTKFCQLWLTRHSFSRRVASRAHCSAVARRRGPPKGTILLTFNF